jgi:hypothetical protein
MKGSKMLAHVLQYQTSDIARIAVTKQLPGRPTTAPIHYYNAIVLLHVQAETVLQEAT